VKLIPWRGCSSGHHKELAGSMSSRTQEGSDNSIKHHKIHILFTRKVMSLASAAYMLAALSPNWT
jgi:hypothetical protein